MVLPISFLDHWNKYQMPVRGLALQVPLRLLLCNLYAVCLSSIFLLLLLVEMTCHCSALVRVSDPGIREVHCSLQTAYTCLSPFFYMAAVTVNCIWLLNKQFWLHWMNCINCFQQCFWNSTCSCYCTDTACIFKCACSIWRYGSVTNTLWGL